MSEQHEQSFTMKLLASGVIAGPDHFVLGDGFGNPGCHASMFVVEERLEQNEEIKQILINRLWEQVSELPFEIVVSLSPKSFRIAQYLADFATTARNKKVFACRCDSELPSGNPRRALIHDNVINRGLHVADLISMMEKHGIIPVALSSLFARIEGPTLFSLPLYSAIERLLPTYDAANCPMCQAELQINQQYGKGREFLRSVKVPDHHTPLSERPERILIVDDEYGIRESFGVFLKNKGYETETAKDYDDAITKLEECHYDLDVILIDQVMPGRSGLELIKTVKKRSSRIQLIMVTGEPTIDTAAESVRLGIFDYLIKPIDLERLFSVVSSAMKLKKANDEARELKMLVHERSQALAASEDRYRTLIQTTGDGMAIIQDDRIILASDRLCEMLGVSSDKIIGAHFSSFISKNDTRDISNLHQRYVSGEGNLGIITTKLALPDGSFIHVEINGSRYTHEGCAAILIGIRDVTDLKQAEQEKALLIHELGERIKEMDCLYGIASLTEKEGLSQEDLFQGVMKLMCKSWQYRDVTCAKITFEECEYRTDNYVQTNWRQQADIIVNSVKKGTVEICYLAEMQNHDEGPFLKEERNLINAVAAQVGKITRRMKAEEALKESEEKFRVICGSALDAMIMMDDDGNTTYFNRAAENMFGYHCAEILGKNIHDAIMPTRFRPEFEKGFKQFVINGTGNAVGKITTLTAKHKDGSEFPIEIALAPIQIKNSYWGSAVIRKISGRNR